MKDPALWEKLRSFPLDDPEAGFRFSERLARENGWTQCFTAEVLGEYRRFLYLSAAAGHAVTPSDAVDQAWHLHLCYTRSYWHDLCRDTLGFPLHHGPTKGGVAERAKYADWYERTLASYREAFGDEPPPAVWPASGVRFAKRDFRRVDASSHFIVRKRHLAALAVGTGLSIPLASCASHLASADGFSVFPVFIIAFVLFVILASIFSKKGGKGGGGCSGGGSCGGGGADSGCSGGGGCGGGCGGGD
ncbi:hypothetical protein HZ994_03430 [Akkermansiaceae bacterium]|nr:hypothetical protein HZ994_03430 [Akkermansiaceae bacterium]